MRLTLFLLAVFCAAAQEPAVHLKFGTAGGRTGFHIGEAIRVTLDFDVQAPQAVQVSTDLRLRHLRPQAPDQFHATPAAGWVDPLADLTWTMDGTVPSTGSWGSAQLDALHPVHIERDLNEFIVFREPGRYMVHVTSARVAAAGKPLTAAIELNILPRDAVWTARQFAAAKATLDTGKPPKEPERVFYPDKETAQVEAVRTLRFLETEPAARYLVSIYGQGRRSSEEIEYALLASPFREAIVDEFDRQMTDPDLSITQDYTITLTEIKARLKERQLGHALSPADWKTLGDVVDKQVFEAASAKHPGAKADTYYYLFKVGSGFLRGSPEVLQKLAAVAPSTSPGVIYQLLTTDWEEISSVRAQLLPMLQQAVARSWPSWGLHVGGMALLRLAELDPPAAADAAMKDLISPQGRFSDPELLELSLPASPALDQALLAQYRQGAPVDARIARFASADIKDDLWRAWSARPGQICVTPLFAYFFRVDPVQAAERLDELRKAGGNACATLDFYEAERQLMSPGLERQLLADAKSANPNIRQAAFRMLNPYRRGLRAARERLCRNQLLRRNRTRAPRGPPALHTASFRFQRAQRILALQPSGG